ncbi:MAG: beta-1,6-N-acetylglucosaminyltransferase [Clostridia bacterium]|nr:beta-1,6-N-acetylglucosaminyltransferase [Clostridia bacterium]
MSEERRQAWLIAAHGGFEQLKALLSLLDDELSDIYLHMDRKARGFREADFTAAVRRGRIFFVPRLRASWGSARFIDVMLSLLRAAAATPHQYYHLLSGADLPLWPQKTIRAFFAAHDGEEFMSYDSVPVRRDVLHYRLGIYQPVYQLNLSGRPARFLNRVTEKIQTLLQVDRLRRCDLVFQKGSLWFSVTQAFADYALAQAPAYRPRFRLSACGDEMFFHSIMAGSPFDARRHRPELHGDPGAAMRYIDWARGNGSSPHTFTLEDYDTLAARPELFARKFDARRDPALFERMIALVRAREVS